MIEAYAAQDVQAAERPLLAAERGFGGGLMHRAATALALEVRRELRAVRGRVAGAAVVALVGPGNNGGDALHALALLAPHGVRVTAVTVSGRVHDGGLAALLRAGGRVLALADAGADDDGAPDQGAPARVWLGDAVAEAFAADVVLDGLLGIGARGGLREPAARLVEVLGGLVEDTLGPLLHGAGGAADGRVAPGAAGRTRPVVIAVDVPSGVGVDDGALPGAVLRADRTVTFGAPKPALLLPPAAGRAGDVVTVDLGLLPGLREQGARPVVRRLEAADVARAWPVPATEAHKYTRGVVGVVAGTRTYPGAAVLAVSGALAAGAGMVRYLGPAAVRDAVLAVHPEVVAGAGRVQAWVLGPGMAEDTEQAGRARNALEQALRDGLPVVVDAGGLGLLPDRVTGRVVLTPHAGELARLLTERGVDVGRADVEAEPLRWARAAHDRTGATVLLKGAVTVVVGEGVVLSQVEAPPWLATAGAGDVLAGVLGAVLAGATARGPLDPAEVAVAAAAAASVHGRAAHAANPGGPFTATAVAAAVPGVIAGLLR